MSHKTLIVENYMKSDVFTLRKDQTLREATLAMIEHKTNGAVVVDDDHHVIAMLSSSDIIKYVVPEYLSQDKHIAMFEAPDVFADRIHAVADHTVEQFMSSRVKSIKKDATLINAIALLAEYHIRQLPVVNEDNVLIGYINRTDLKRAIGDVLLDQENTDNASS